MRVLVLLYLVVAVSADFQLSVVHLNDFHSRFDDQSPTSGVCKENDSCHGGFARLYTAVQGRLSYRKNAILLNAGDNYQGTLWYNIFKWSAVVYFMNMLPITAYTLGNHEFDDGIGGVVPMLQQMKAPCIVSNIDDSQEPEIRGLYNKSVVLKIGGKKIGIVGVITRNTPMLSNSEGLIFLDEIDSVNSEADRLMNEDGVFTVVVLSHCGYDKEKEMARKATKSISLIVGAHSHSLLYTGSPPDGSIAEGDYPTVITRDIDGKTVLVVQAAAYTRYLGDIVVNYNDGGDVISHEGAPLYLSSDFTKDKIMVHHLQPFKEIIDKKGAEYYGETAVVLEKEGCFNDECNLGNLITDAMVYSHERDGQDGTWTEAALAILNPGDVRISIPIGNITYNDIIASAPFGNTYDYGDLQGKYIKEFFEYSTMPWFSSESSKVEPRLNILQLSGFKVVYDLSQPADSRVRSVQVRSRTDRTKFENLDYDKYYSIAMTSFLGNGGDGFAMISDNVVNYTEGRVDLDVFKEYFPIISPINIQKEGRITFVGADERPDKHLGNQAVSLSASSARKRRNTHAGRWGQRQKVRMGSRQHGRLGGRQHRRLGGR